MKKITKVIVVISALMMLFALIACSNGGDDNNSSGNNSSNSNGNSGNGDKSGNGNNGTTDTATEDANRFFVYDANTNSFSGTVTWTAENTVEQVLVGYVDYMLFTLYDANEQYRWSRQATVKTDLSKLTVTGSLTISEDVIFKWADIPGTTLKAELYFTTGSNIVVKEQSLVKGPVPTSTNFSAEEFLRNFGGSSTFGNGNVSGSDTFAAAWANGTYHTNSNNIQPTVKVSSITVSAFGNAYEATVDWTDKDVLALYNEKGFYDYKTHAGTPPGTKFSPNLVLYYWRKGYTDSNHYSFIGKSNEQDSTANIVLTIKSTTNNTYKVTTTLAEIASIM